ncbi:MAG: sulfotransferase domain-containing protein [Akkermansiaceae bacterium]
MNKIIKQINKHYWNSQRFGFDPKSIYSRLAGNTVNHRILVVSIPKAGTHLIERAICLWPQCYRTLKPTLRKRNNWGGLGLANTLKNSKKGSVHFAHTPWSKEVQKVIDDLDIKVVFIIRNPVDIIISHAHFVVKLKTHWLYEYFKDIEPIEKRIKIMLNGEPIIGLTSFRDHIEANREWLNNGAMVVRFEDLVGQCGGGDDAKQSEILNRLWNYLNLGCDDLAKRTQFKKLVFSDVSPTFRQGAIGKTPKELELLELEQRDSLNSCMQILGYE